MDDEHHSSSRVDNDPSHIADTESDMRSKMGDHSQHDHINSHKASPKKKRKSAVKPVIERMATRSRQKK